jgi:hypothetical protein
VTEDEAQAAQILQLQADFGDVNSADYQSQIDLLVTADEAIVSDITTLQAEVEGIDGLIDSTALIQQELVTQAATDAALASDISNLQTSTGDNTLLIQSEATARIEGDTALGVRIDTIQLQVEDGDGGVLEGSVQQLLQVVGIDADGSDDGQIDTLTAQYSLKTEVNGYISGFGLYNDGETSDFGIHADTFYIASPMSAQADGQPDAYEQVFPFIIAPWTPPDVNGVPQAPIDVIALNALTLIPDASIGTAMIQNASIETAQIGNLISSDDYVTGLFNPGAGQGWGIWKDYMDLGFSFAEFDSISVRGAINATSFNGYGTVGSGDIGKKQVTKVKYSTTYNDGLNAQHANTPLNAFAYRVSAFSQVTATIDCYMPDWVNFNGVRTRTIYGVDWFWLYVDTWIRASKNAPGNNVTGTPGPWYIASIRYWDLPVSGIHNVTVPLDVATLMNVNTTGNTDGADWLYDVQFRMRIYPVNSLRRDSPTVWTGNSSEVNQVNGKYYTYIDNDQFGNNRGTFGSDNPNGINRGVLDCTIITSQR